MINQLTELLTNYGHVDIIWFDGAGQDKSVSGTYMPFDWPRIYTAIRDCQPHVLIDGGTCTRWVGNESGMGKKTQWSVQSVNVDELFQMSSAIHGLDLKNDELGTVKDLKKGKLLHWLPARGGTPTRAGWFWHERSDHTVRSLHDCIHIYFSSVGQNSPLQYNLAPDKHGRIPEGEKKLFSQMGEYLRELYRINYAEGGTLSINGAADPVITSAIMSDDPYEGWTAESNSAGQELILTLPEKRTFNVIKLRENIQDYGQRISSFALDIKNDSGEWVAVHQGTTVGYRQLIKINTVLTDCVRLTINSSRKNPSLSHVALFSAPELLVAPDITRDNDGNVVIHAISSDADIRYTTNGTEPDENSDLYTGPFSLVNTAEVKAALFVKNSDAYFNADKKCLSVRQFGDLPKDWSITARAQEGAVTAESLINIADADPMLSFQSPSDAGMPFDVIIDLGKRKDIAGFSYLPEQKNYKGMIIPSGDGLIRFYSFFVSDSIDEQGTPVQEGEFANIENNPVRQCVWFDKPANGRFVCLRTVSCVNEQKYVKISELQVFTV
jgi:alpha-L-fucosidase